MSDRYRITQQLFAEPLEEAMDEHGTIAAEDMDRVLEGARVTSGSWDRQLAAREQADEDALYRAYSAHMGIESATLAAGRPDEEQAYRDFMESVFGMRETELVTVQVQA